MQRDIEDHTLVLLLNLYNELGKSDKMRGLPSILSFFLNRFNKSIVREHEY